jgi:hypothetical protein
MSLINKRGVFGLLRKVGTKRQSNLDTSMRELKSRRLSSRIRKALLNERGDHWPPLSFRNMHNNLKARMYRSGSRTLIFRLFNRQSLNCVVEKSRDIHHLGRRVVGKVCRVYLLCRGINEFIASYEEGTIFGSLPILRLAKCPLILTRRGQVAICFNISSR